MIAVTIPTTDVNSESATVVRWYVDDRAEVSAGDPLVEVETSKAIVDVEAPDSGVLLHVRAAGEQLKMDQALGYLFDSVETLETFERERSQAPTEPDESAGRITVPARRRADELGVDIDAVARANEGLITTKLVDAFAAQTQPVDKSSLPDPLAAPPGTRRLVLVGAGLAATQVIDILLHDERQQAVAIVDDDSSRFGEVIEGVPVIGSLDRAVTLFGKDAFDAAVITVGTSIAPRVRLRERCQQAGIPLANVIDPSVRIAAGVTFGTGNIICAHCHFGVGTTVGDNNLISAHNSFDHHSTLGSDITTGPGCVTSGLVTIEDRCRFGMGISLEPKVTIGAGSQISSGSVIVSSVPPEHAVKTKIITTTVVPLRRS